MMRFKFVLIGILISVLSFNSFSTSIVSYDSLSRNGFLIPKNIKACNNELDKVLTEKAKKEFRRYSDSDIASLNIGGMYIVFEWLEDDSRLTHYFDQLQITDLHDQLYLIYKSYHAHLNKADFNFEGELKLINKKRDNKKEVFLKVYGKNSKLDSIDKVYIPKDLEDAMNQLYKDVRPETKEKLKLGNSKISDSLSTSLINYWKIMQGSRLGVYFQDIGIKQLLVMPEIIVFNFGRRLKGDTTNFDVELKQKLEIRKEQESSPNSVQYYSEDFKRFVKTRKITERDIHLLNESFQRINKEMQKRIN